MTYVTTHFPLYNPYSTVSGDKTNQFEVIEEEAKEEVDEEGQEIPNEEN